MDKKFAVIIRSVTQLNCEDTMKDGLIGEEICSFSEKNLGCFDSVKEVIEHCCNRYSIPKKGWYIDCIKGSHVEGLLQNSFMVNENNEYMDENKQFMEKWKKGKVRAWEATFQVDISFAEMWKPSKQELKKHIGFEIVD